MKTTFILLVAIFMLAITCSAAGFNEWNKQSCKPATNENKSLRCLLKVVEQEKGVIFSYRSDLENAVDGSFCMDVKNKPLDYVLKGLSKRGIGYKVWGKNIVLYRKDSVAILVGCSKGMNESLRCTDNYLTDYNGSLNRSSDLSEANANIPDVEFSDEQGRGLQQNVKYVNSKSYNLERIVTRDKFGYLYYSLTKNSFLINKRVELKPKGLTTGWSSYEMQRGFKVEQQVTGSALWYVYDTIGTIMRTGYSPSRVVSQRVTGVQYISAPFFLEWKSETSGALNYNVGIGGLLNLLNVEVAGFGSSMLDFGRSSRYQSLYLSKVNFNPALSVGMDLEIGNQLHIYFDTFVRIGTFLPKEYFYAGVSNGFISGKISLVKTF